MEDRYRVTVYVAAPGTPLREGGTSAAGHMYYSISDGHGTTSYGFAPAVHGASSGRGKVYDSDVREYKEPYYSRTMEISKEQYEKLKDFGNRPQAHGFSTDYDGLRNSCIDFTWGALNHAGLHRTTTRSVQEKNFEGGIKPLTNVEYIRSIPDPFPGSELNDQHTNEMPARTLLQRIISDERLKGEDRLMLDAIRKGVADIDKKHGRTPDEISERLSVGLLATAKASGLERVDHVLLGNTPGDGSTQRLFVVQGDPGNPAHVRASIAVEEAARTPVEQSFAKVEQLSQTQQERALVTQLEEPSVQQARAPLQMG